MSHLDLDALAAVFQNCTGDSVEFSQGALPGQKSLFGASAAPRAPSPGRPKTPVAPRPSLLESIADEEAKKPGPLPGQGEFAFHEPAEEFSPVHHAVAQRFNIPPAAVKSVLETHPDELARRARYVAPSSQMHDVVGPTLDYEDHPLGTARIGWPRHSTGNTNEAYVDFLREFDPSKLNSSEHDQSADYERAHMKKSGSVTAYVNWLKDGHKPPPISVYDVDGKPGVMQSTNRRRLLAAQMSGAKSITGWHGTSNPETGNPLNYGDIMRAAKDHETQSFSRDDEFGPVEFGRSHTLPTQPFRRLIDKKRTHHDVLKEEEHVGKKKKVPTDNGESGWTKVGGSSVHVDDDGVIDKGCPGLLGEEVEDLIDESDESRERREARQHHAYAAGVRGHELTPAQAKALGSDEHVAAYRRDMAAAKAHPVPTVSAIDVARGFDDQTGLPITSRPVTAAHSVPRDGGNGHELRIEDDARTAETEERLAQQPAETFRPAPELDPRAKPYQFWKQNPLSQILGNDLPRPSWLGDRPQPDHAAGEKLEPQLEQMEAEIARIRELRDAFLSKRVDIAALKANGYSSAEIAQAGVKEALNNKLEPLVEARNTVKAQLDDYLRQARPDYQRQQDIARHKEVERRLWERGAEEDSAVRRAAKVYGADIDEVIASIPRAMVAYAEANFPLEAAKAEARRLTGLNAHTIRSVEDEIPDGDIKADSLLRTHPELGWQYGDTDNQRKMVELIREGSAQMPSRTSSEIADLAASMVVGGRPRDFSTEGIHFRDDSEDESLSDSDEWSPAGDTAETSFDPSSWSRSDSVESIAAALGVSVSAIQAVIQDMPGSRADGLASLSRLARDPSRRGVVRSREGHVIGYVTRNGNQLTFRDGNSRFLGTATHGHDRATFRDRRGHVGGSVGQFSRSLDEIGPVEFSADPPSQVHHTQTPAFKKWHEGSHVVHEDGKPKVVYHGTNALFDEFSDDALGGTTSASTTALGHYFTNKPEIAGQFGKGEGQHVKPVYLSIKKPLVVEPFKGDYEHENHNGQRVRVYKDGENFRDGGKDPFHAMKRDWILPVVQQKFGSTATHPKQLTRDDFANFKSHMAKQGFDGITIKQTQMDAPLGPRSGEHDFHIAFHPHQIKSAIGNSGAFDPQDNRITFSRDFGPVEFGRSPLPGQRELPFDAVKSKRPQIETGHDGTRQVDLPETRTNAPFRATLKTGKTDGLTHFVTLDHAGKDWSKFRAPTQHVERFLDELHGHLSHPANSGHKTLDHVLSGGGKYIGKGNDNAVYDAGNGTVVKAAVITPYHEGNGLRSPDAANAIIDDSVKATKHLRSKGVLGILPQYGVNHDGRSFAVMPKVDTTSPLTEKHIQQLQDTLSGMHSAGYRLGDQVQAGLDHNGNAAIYDVGSVSALDPERDGAYGHNREDDDFSELSRLAEKHGIKYTRPKLLDKASKYRQMLHDVLDSKGMTPEEAWQSQHKLHSSARGLSIKPKGFGGATETQDPEGHDEWGMHDAAREQLEKWSGKPTYQVSQRPPSTVQMSRDSEVPHPFEQRYSDAVASGDNHAAQKHVDHATNVALKSHRDKWGEAGVESFASAKNGDITLHSVKVPKEHRGQGRGTAYMNDLHGFADKHGMRVLLTPDDSFGASSVGRLKRFYGGLGYHANAGRNKDFRTREAMIRHPANYEGKSAYAFDRDESGGVVPLQQKFGITIPHDAETNQFSRKPATGQGSFDWDEEAHPRDKNHQQFAPVHPTQTPEFKAWHDGSHVVHEDGRPKVVYRGQDVHADSFRVSDDGESGAGIYLTESPDVASRYASVGLGPGRAAPGANVSPVYVSIKNPYRGSWNVYNSLAGKLKVPNGSERDELIRRGHDGIIRHSPDGKVHEIVAFHPSQIKSAIGNSGAFDPKDNRITFSRDFGPVEFGRKPASGQSSFDWDEEAHPRDDAGRFADKLHHQIKNYLLNGGQFGLPDIHHHTGHTDHDALDPLANPTTRALKSLVDADAISRTGPEHHNVRFYMTDEQRDQHEASGFASGKSDAKSDGKPEEKPQAGPAGLTKREAIAKASANKSGDKGLSHDEMVHATYLYTGTAPQGWSAVAVKGMKEVEGDKGEGVTVPEFEMPSGYKPVPVVWDGGPQSACCGLCGHDIKNIYYIQNDAEKWTMGVGSECVTKFGEGDSGERLVKKAAWAANRDFLSNVWETFDTLGHRFGDTDKHGQHHTHLGSSAPFWKIMAESGVKNHNEIAPAQRKDFESAAAKINSVYGQLKKLLYNSAGAPVTHAGKKIMSRNYIDATRGYKDSTAHYDASKDAAITAWTKRNAEEARKLIGEVDEILRSLPESKKQEPPQAFSRDDESPTLFHVTKKGVGDIIRREGFKPGAAQSELGPGVYLAKGEERFPSHLKRHSSGETYETETVTAKLHPEAKLFPLDSNSPNTPLAIYKHLYPKDYGARYDSDSHPSAGKIYTPQLKVNWPHLHGLLQGAGYHGIERSARYGDVGNSDMVVFDPSHVRPMPQAQSFSREDDFGPVEFARKPAKGQVAFDFESPVESHLDDTPGENIATKQDQLFDVQESDVPPEHHEEAKALSAKHGGGEVRRLKNGDWQLRAPIGGKVSEVNGVFYIGGRFMPIHGIDSQAAKKLKPKREKPKGDLFTPPKPNENGRQREKRVEMTPDEIAAEKERREEQRQWNEIASGPLGRLLDLGDKPRYGQKATPNLDEWMSFAEKIGKEGIDKLHKSLEADAHGKIDALWKSMIDDQAGLSLDEIARKTGMSIPRRFTAADAEWDKNELRERADRWSSDKPRLYKAHEKLVPGSHRVRELLSALMEDDYKQDKGGLIPRLKKYSDMLAALVPAPLISPAEARQHGYFGNKFDGRTADGKKVKAGDGWVKKNADGKYETFTDEQVRDAIQPAEFSRSLDSIGPVEFAADSEEFSRDLADFAPVEFGLMDWFRKKQTPQTPQTPPSSAPAGDDPEQVHESKWSPEVPVESSNVHSYSWEKQGNEGQGNMIVRYKNKEGGSGPVYRYIGTPRSVYEGMEAAPSKGGFVWDRLRVRGSKVAHQYPFSLAGTGATDYIPRAASLRRGFKGEHYIERSFQGRKSELAPGTTTGRPAERLDGYDPGKLTFKPSPPSPSLPKPVTPQPPAPSKTSSLISKVASFFRKPKTPREFSRDEIEAFELMLADAAARD